MMQNRPYNSQDLHEMHLLQIQWSVYVYAPRQLRKASRAQPDSGRCAVRGLCEGGAAMRRAVALVSEELSDHGKV